jgi:hypothetical protein
LPKLSKEKHDEVISYLKKGYTIGETAQKTGTSRSFVSKINTSINEEKEIVEKTTEKDTLSKESMQILFRIMGVYGHSSLDETIKQLGEDFRVISQAKYEFDLDHSKTISDVFVQVVNDSKSNKKSLNNVLRARDNNYHQRLLFHAWNVDPAVPVIYDMASSFGFEGTLFDFLTKTVVESFKEKGWTIEYYYNAELGSQQPILIDPSGYKLKFP